MKVISFSLWGKKPMYTIGALRNAEIAKEIFPDWQCWFYVGSSCPDEIVDKLREKDNTQVYLMDEEGSWNGMFWRFSPASDPNVDVVLSRDTDSRLSLREKKS